MMRRRSEKISMLLDGELSTSETRRALRDLQNDGELRDYWLHCNLISDALRKELPCVIKQDFAAGVMRRIAAEPPIEKSPSRFSFLHFSPFTKYAAYATAFSVAVIAVLVARWQSTDFAPAAQTEIVAAAREPVPAVIPAASPSAAEVADVDLYDYLVSHTESVHGATVHGGMLPYVNLVGYEAEQDIR